MTNEKIYFERSTDVFDVVNKISVNQLSYREENFVCFVVRDFCMFVSSVEQRFVCSSITEDCIVFACHN